MNYIYAARDYITIGEVVPYEVVSESGDSLILEDTSCSHFPRCQVEVSKKDLMLIGPGNDEGANHIDIHKKAVFFYDKAECESYVNKLHKDYYESMLVELNAKYDQAKSTYEKYVRGGFNYVKPELSLSKDIYLIEKKYFYINYGQLSPIVSAIDKIDEFSIIPITINKKTTTQFYNKKDSSITEHSTYKCVMGYDEELLFDTSRELVKVALIVDGDYNDEDIKINKVEYYDIAFSSEQQAKDYVISILTDKLRSIVNNLNNQIIDINNRLTKLNN